MTEPSPTDIKATKSVLSTGRKDAAGFSIDDVPSLTSQQVLWVMHRLDTRTDEEACAATFAETDSPIDADVVAEWRTDPTFESVYQDCLTNKREAFRYTTGQMLPKAGRVIYQLLHSPREKAQIEGLKLLLRVQGLLIDRVQTYDPDAMENLMAALRERKPTPIIAATTYKELGPGE